MEDQRWMRHALALADRARGTVSPNPLVGCVLVREGRVVGEGWTQPPGGPHAETVALAAAGDLARGAVAYVTLEPCAHSGRTGPCAPALAVAGVKRVVAATVDPNPLAAGGAEVLRQAGIVVDVGLLGEEAREHNAVFLHAVASGRPHVTVKVATSLDGRVAAADGGSQWLTGRAARQRAHALRAEADAVVVGSGTVLTDDPLLTARLKGYRGAQPLRVVLDRHGRTSAAAKVYDDRAPTLAFLGGDADPAPLRAAGVDVHVGLADPAGVLGVLWERGVRGVLVEGGPSVATAFLVARLADRLVLHIAGVLLGAGGLPGVGDLGVASLAAAPRWRLVSVEAVGGDVLCAWRPEKGT